MRINIKILSITIATLLGLIALPTQASAKQFYGEKICQIKSQYQCYDVKNSDSWQSLFPDPEKRDLVKRLNRTNLNLRSYWTIAVPKNLERINYFDIAPFPLQKNPFDQKTIFVSLKKHAWAAYNKQGHLIHWGPISGGRDWCKKLDQSCKTRTGIYTLKRKQGAGCVSGKYPLDTDGGAPMPFCMHYFGGYALHGSYVVPGHHASHGCVRMFINDARWLNKQFADYSTKFIIRN